MMELGLGLSLSLIAGAGGGDGVALPSTVSGSIRSLPMTGQAGSIAGGERRTWRQFDRSNVRCADPWFEFHGGRILATGVVGMSIETTIAGSAHPNNYRAAILVGVSGTGANQSAATLHELTFFGMLNDAAFVAAGGAVSPDGKTITVPNGYRFRSDRLIGVILVAGQAYVIQSEGVAASGAVNSFPTGRLAVPALGDMSVTHAAAHSGVVYSKDWTGLNSSGLGSAFGPIAVLGTGEPGVKTVIVDGDSIISLSASPATGPFGTSDIGNSLGAVAFAKRALSEAGYSFIDVSIPGSNIGNFMAGFDKSGIRADLMKYGDAVITDHGHNDRKSGTAFDAVAGWTEASPAAWNSTGLRTRMAWHNDWLRTKLKPGARVVRCTLAPTTTSTDSWATPGNQTGKNDDAVWQADYATAANGDQFKFSDLVMFRGLYAGLAPGGAGLHDAGYDLYVALGGTADGKWPNGGTLDGTHPAEALQIAAGADLKPRLAALIGW